MCIPSTCYSDIDEDNKQYPSRCFEVHNHDTSRNSLYENYPYMNSLSYENISLLKQQKCTSTLEYDTQQNGLCKSSCYMMNIVWVRLLFYRNNTGCVCYDLLFQASSRTIHYISYLLKIRYTKTFVSIQIYDDQFKYLIVNSRGMYDVHAQRIENLLRLIIQPVNTSGNIRLSIKYTKIFSGGSHLGWNVKDKHITNTAEINQSLAFSSVRTILIPHEYVESIFYSTLSIIPRRTITCVTTHVQIEQSPSSSTTRTPQCVKSQFNSSGFLPKILNSLPVFTQFFQA